MRLTDEAHGEAYGFSLVYSGNFLAEAEVEPYGTARVRLGIEPSTFGWRLEPGGSFTVPEAIVAFSERGLGGVSDALHDAVPRSARPRPLARPARPVLINNWEATYFGFDADRLVEIATTARDLGVELFVLDDGWYGARDDDTTSLGDWFVDRRKLPDGLDGVARRITELGIGFGLWIEPEMVSERSRLFEAHPDWAIGIPGRPRTESRQQLVLDMARPEVVDHLTTVLSEVLGSAPIAYVKWDMNRNITEPFSPSLPPDRQGEFFHRYILGTYELYRRLTERFPEILFESCAGGGGRFDPGLLAFAPQAWTSDDTDAIERLPIQWGTSLAYPLSSMAAHVAAVPNHQVGRITPLSTRAAVAFFGVFGYELDPTALDDEERTAIVEQITLLQGASRPVPARPVRPAGQPVRGRRQPGRLDERGRRPAPGRRRGLSDPVPCRPGTRPAPPPRAGSGCRLPGRRRWPGYDDTLARANVGVRSGAELMAAGLVLDAERWENAVRGDFWARLFVLDAV